MLSQTSTENLINSFILLGLGREHAVVYLNSLELGPSPASTIAKTSGLPRSSTYDILAVLIKEGLLSAIENETKKIFTANSPEIILDLIKSRQANINENV